jgi:hypothetical protein
VIGFIYRICEMGVYDLCSFADGVYF